MKVTIFLLLVFYYLIDDITMVAGGGDIGGIPSCSDLNRCSIEPNTIWATDAISCYVFLNPCQLDLENCNRDRIGLKPLEKVEQENCKCKLDCPECDKPVCGSLGCQLLDFPSLCWLDYYNCKTGQVYTLHNEGPCDRK